MTCPKSPDTWGAAGQGSQEGTKPEAEMTIKERPSFKKPLVSALYISLLEKQEIVDFIYCTN